MKQVKLVWSFHVKLLIRIQLLILEKDCSSSSSVEKMTISLTIKEEAGGETERRLPNEVSLKIFQMLDCKALQQARLVSKSWREAVTTDIMERRLKLQWMQGEPSRTLTSVSASEFGFPEFVSRHAFGVQSGAPR